jgi:hypothetical protein
MRKRNLILIGFLFSLVACQSISPMPPIRDPQITMENLPSRADIHGITPVKAIAEASCVPACLEMIFRFYGKDLKKEEISDWIQRGRGSQKDVFEQFLVMKGFEIYPFYDWHSDKRRIKYFLSQGYPVLAAGQITNIHTLHLTVVSGYDDNVVYPESDVNSTLRRGFFYIYDPGLGKRAAMWCLKFNEFQQAEVEMYRHYCLVTWPKDLFPEEW